MSERSEIVVNEILDPNTWGKDEVKKWAVTEFGLTPELFLKKEQ